MNAGRVDFNLLNVFQAVMLESSVTRAAHRLATTQPAVSNALKRLRLLFGDELFVKAPGGVIPTERAKVLWAELEGPMTAVGSVVSPGRFDPARSRRVFSLSITESLTAKAVAPIAIRFAREAPQAKLRFQPHANPSSLASLERGELDCAIGMFPNVPPNLTVEGLLGDEYICVMRKNHPHIKVPVPLDAFASARHILVLQSTAGSSIVDEWLSLQGIKRNVAITVNSCADALAVVVGSDMIATIPKQYLIDHEARDQVSQTALPLASQRILYKLVWHERTSRDPAQAWLRQIVKGAVKDAKRGFGAAATAS